LNRTRFAQIACHVACRLHRAGRRHSLPPLNPHLRRDPVSFRAFDRLEFAARQDWRNAYASVIKNENNIYIFQ
jgi:hypothetical protein